MEQQYDSYKNSLEDSVESFKHFNYRILIPKQINEQVIFDL